MARPMRGRRRRSVSWQAAAAALWIVIGMDVSGEESQREAQTAGLLELVPPELRFEEKPLPADRNGYPLLLEAVSAFVDPPNDEENMDFEAILESHDAGAP